MASFSDISIRFNADLNQFSTEIQNAQRKMDKFGKKLQKVGGALSIGVTLPILGMGAAAVKAASDAEETRSKFQTVFRDVSNAAQASADVLRNSYGLSSTASQQLLGDTGDLLTGFGFSQKAALDLSTEVNKLAVDLASFTNFSGGAEGASAALTKALLGERESVKSLGISILEVDVKAKMLQQSQEGLTFETDRQAKAFATLTLAQEQSKNAIGDYERTSDSFANQMRLLKARLNDVSVEFGVIMLPYVTKLAQYVGRLIEKFSGLDESTKKIIVVVGLLAAAIGPLLVGLGVLMTTVIPGLTTAFAGLNAVMIANPIGLVIAAIGALTFAFTAMMQEVTPAVSKMQTFINLVRSGGNYTSFMAFQLRDQAAAAGEAMVAIDKLNAVLGNGIDPRKKTPDVAPAAFVAPVLPTGITEQLDELTDLQKIEMELETDILKRDLVDLNQLITDTGGTLDLAKQNAQLEAFDGKLGDIYESWLTLEDLPDPFKDFTEGLVNIGDAINSSLQGAIANTAQFFGDFIGALATGNAGVEDLFKGLLGVVVGFMETLGQALIAAGVASEAFKNLFASGIGAIVAGAALMALAGVVKGIMGSGLSGGGGGARQMPAFADGGLVYGPTVGLIGEYSGARNNPEVIAPLSKLKDMLSDTGGGQRVEVVGVLKGTDMHLQNARTQNYLKRRR